MKVYRQDPAAAAAYRTHFLHQVGGELPGFKGARLQYGNGIGSLLGILARKAIPLIQAGAKIVAPHIKKAAKNVAKDVTSHVAEGVIGAIDKRRQSKPKARRRKRVKRATSKKDIFA